MPDEETKAPTLTREQIVANVHEKLAQTLDGNLDTIIAVFEQAIDVTTTQRGYCPTCKGKVQAEFPDWKGRDLILNTFFDRVMGKPTQRTEEKRDINVSVAMSEMTDEQLIQLAGRRAPKALEPVIEGQIVEP